MIFYVVRLSAVCNVNVLKCRNVELPKVSTLDFGRDSEMMEMLVDVTEHFVSEFQGRMKTCIWK